MKEIFKTDIFTPIFLLHIPEESALNSNSIESFSLLVLHAVAFVLLEHAKGENKH